MSWENAKSLGYLFGWSFWDFNHSCSLVKHYPTFLPSYLGFHISMAQANRSQNFKLKNIHIQKANSKTTQGTQEDVMITYKIQDTQQLLQSLWTINIHLYHTSTMNATCLSRSNCIARHSFNEKLPSPTSYGKIDHLPAEDLFIGFQK